MAIKIPSTAATDGALSMYPMTSMEEVLDAPTWDPVGLVTNWSVNPTTENELLFYGGDRRLQNNKKLGAQYSLTFDADVHALDLFDKCTKDVVGAGTPAQFHSFACKVKYDLIDYYWLLIAGLFGEASLTVGRGILKSSYTVPIVRAVDTWTLAEFRTETGLDVAENPTFNVPPAPDPLYGQSPGVDNPLPLSINGTDLEFESVTIRQTNVVILKRSSNVEIATAAIIGHQQTSAEFTLFEESRDPYRWWKNNTELDIELIVSPTKSLVMEGFKASSAPINHPQTGDDLNRITLATDGPACVVTTIP
jgi:hypothetical protein